MRLQRYLDSIAASALRDELGLEDDAPALVRRTNDARFGDYQINGVMPLAKQLGQAPRELAGPVAVRMADQDAIWSAEVAGPGFVNLRLADDWIAERLTEHLRDDRREGVPETDAPQKVVVDYSSPNIAKQMHVGHLRSTIIGDALARLLRFIGHDVVADNHLGDWGTQFGLLIAGMREWGSGEALDRAPISELERIYRLASDRAKEDDSFAAHARQELAKLQSGEDDNVALWRRFAEATRSSLERVYERLDIEFDEWLGESAYHEMLPQTVQRLVDAGIAREDQGAVCIFWNEIEGAPEELKKQKEPFIIRKHDGAYLYSTTDIATLIYRHERLGADWAVYVVDTRQSLHFRQLFALAQLLGIDMQLDHVGFGTVLGSDGRPLRTREGGSITLDDLLDEAEQRAADRIREEGLDIPDDEIPTVAHAVGVGAVKYADLRQNRLSDYRFDWSKMLSFKGNAGPYLQYAYARIQSILRKGNADEAHIRDRARIVLDHEAESALARELMTFSDIVHDAAETYEPHWVCDHLYALARAFSTFYEECPVLRAGTQEQRDSRLGLAVLTARQIRCGLQLLGIRTVDRM